MKEEIRARDGERVRDGEKEGDREREIESRKTRKTCVIQSSQSFRN